MKLRLAASIAWQKLWGIDRTAENSSVVFRKGTNWFSITDDLARYVLSKKEWIEETFRDSYCCDEVFLQTIVYNSDFQNRLYYTETDSVCSNNLRLIDWTRGRPYVFRMTDKQELLDSPCLFVRKIDEKVDGELAEFLCDRLKLRQVQSERESL